MTTWLQHVKKVHAAGSTSFKESLKRASASWKKIKAGGKATTAAPKRKNKRGRKKKDEEQASTEEPEAPKKKRRKAKKTYAKKPAGAFTNIDSKNLS